VNIKQYGHNLVIAILVTPIGIGIGLNIGQSPTKPQIQPKAIVKVEPIGTTPASAKTLALNSLDDFGWKSNQFGCLAKLWGKESAWNYKAVNKRTHDHGIPQRHMSHNTVAQRKAFLSDPVAQINWGLKYIDHRYDTPCRALDFWKRNNWY
jgi:hypothetical protein